MLCSALKRFFLALTLLSFAAGCSDSGSKNEDSGPVVDTVIGDDVTPSDGLLKDGVSGEDGAEPVILPPVPERAGVAYVAHMDSEELMYYRTSGTEATLAGTFDLGTVSHNLALDPYNDLLFVVSDASKSVRIFKLDRPASATAPVAAPTELAKIDTETMALFAQVNPLTKRLYVVVGPAGGTGPTFGLMVYNITDPANPTAITGAPFEIPGTSAVAIDPARNIFFVVGILDDKLYLYDLANDGLTQLPGEPLDFKVAYPETHQSAMNPRGISVDMFRNRLYGAKSLSVKSELIAIEYPAALPSTGQSYGQLASHADLKIIADPFDASVDMDSRPHIMEAHRAVVDLQRGHVMLSGGSWVDEIPGMRSMIVGIKSDMTLGAGCGAFEDFGCWIRAYENGAETTHLASGGALCVDYTHQVVLGTGYDPANRDGPGMITMHRYDDDLVMTPLAPAGGASPETGNKAISAVCH